MLKNDIIKSKTCSPRHTKIILIVTFLNRLFEAFQKSVFTFKLLKIDCKLQAKRKRANLEKGVTRKQSRSNFPKNEHFLPPDRHTGVFVSGGKKCSFFRKFDLLGLLVTPVLRFALLPYYRRNIVVLPPFFVYFILILPASQLKICLIFYFADTHIQF